jgi:hypothetical protein
MPNLTVRRSARTTALAGIAVIILTATTVAFFESFDGLYQFASGHGLTGFWSAVWPLQVDAFILIGELTIFVGIVDRFDKRGKILAWVATLGGTVISVVGNVLHVATAHAHDAVWLGTAAVPPVAATAGLMIGLQVLKRAAHIEGTAAVPVIVTVSAGLGAFHLRPLDWTLRRGPESLARLIVSPPPASVAIPPVKPAPIASAPARAITAPSAGSAAKYDKAMEILHAAGGAMTGRELAEALGQANRVIPNKVIKDYREGVRP